MLKRVLRLLFCGLVLLLLFLRCFEVGGKPLIERHSDPQCECPDYRNLPPDAQNLEYIRSSFLNFPFQKPWVQKPEINLLGSKKSEDPSVLESFSFENPETGDLFRISVIDVGKEFKSVDYLQYSHKKANVLEQKGAVFQGFGFPASNCFGMRGRFGDQLFFIRFYNIRHYLVFVEGATVESTKNFWTLLERIEFKR